MVKLIVDEFEISGEWRLNEVYPLLDETVSLRSNGKMNYQPNKVPFQSLVAYTLKTYAGKIGYSEDVLADNRYQYFCQSIKIRHKITHPKFHSDIEISNEELQLIDEGREWWKHILQILWTTHHGKNIGS